MKRLPQWIERSMQGLVFWIGHRRALYGGHLLTEGAIVAETCNLIIANLRDNKTLLCEQLYKELVDTLKLAAGCRADLVIRERSNTRDKKGKLFAVIEVKRGRSSSPKITEDLKRLAEVKMSSPEVWTLLLLVSESKRPSDFVDISGKASREKHHLDNTECDYKVRRACKASASFEGTNSAHYACIIEVLKCSKNCVSQD